MISVGLMTWEQYRPLNEEEKGIQDAAKGKVKKIEG